LRDRPDSGCPWSDRDHSAPARKVQGARTKAWSTNDSRGLVGDCDFVLLVIGRFGRCLQPPDAFSKVDPPITTDADMTDRRESSAIVRAVYPFCLYYTPSHGFGWHFDAVCARIPIGSSSPEVTKRFYQNLFLENLVRGKRSGSPIAHGRTGQSPAIGITGSGCRNVVSGE
jgi:hypothetical protein